MMSGGIKTKPDCLTFVRDNRDYDANVQKIVPYQLTRKSIIYGLSDEIYVAEVK